MEKARAGRSTLLIAPTGAGKTLAGFLPTLTALHERPAVNRPEGRGIHTLYISPLKALAVDIARNLEAPVAEMGLAVSIETRTGDTPVHKRQRQKLKPPDILLTTPEQVALLLSATDAARFFGDLDTVILDELHALVTSKRGDLLALGLARLRVLAPRLKTIGLSATVADPDALRGWLVGQDGEAEGREGRGSHPLQQGAEASQPLIPAHAGIQFLKDSPWTSWIPACAGMSGLGRRRRPLTLPRVERWVAAVECEAAPSPRFAKLALRLAKRNGPLPQGERGASRLLQRARLPSPTSSWSRAGRSRTSRSSTPRSGSRGRGIRRNMPCPTSTNW